MESYPIGSQAVSERGTGGRDRASIELVCSTDDGTVFGILLTVMQDPYLPKASRPESSDPLLGVDMSFAEWAKGIAIGVPANPNDTTIERPLFEPVHSPVSGQVVWLGNYTISRAPGNHRNDEKSFAVMVC